MKRTTIDPLLRLKYLAILVLALAAFFSIYAYLHYRETTALIERGKPAAAAIEGITRRSKAGITVSYEATVRYQVDEKPVHAKLLVNNELGNRLWNGQGPGTIPIVYLPENPTVAELADESQRAWGHGDAIEPYTGFFLTIPVAIWGLLVLLTYRRRKQESELKAGGGKNGST